MSSYSRCSRRLFSSSSRLFDHYKTLGLPQNATRAQIKSNFYKLSKQHHPDLSKEESSRDIFRAANEAYTVLGNERERRAYDRTLKDQQQQLQRKTPGHSSRSGYADWRDVRRRTGATHAWQGGRPGQQQQAPRRSPPPGQTRTYPKRDPDAYHTVGNSGRSAGSAMSRRAEQEYHDHDRIYRVSHVVRALQVVGIFGLACIVIPMFSGVGHTAQLRSSFLPSHMECSYSDDSTEDTDSTDASV